MGLRVAVDKRDRHGPPPAWCGGTGTGTGGGPALIRVWPGESYPLGATVDGPRTNFALFSEAAEQVDLRLFDAQRKETQVVLPETTAHCWHGYLPGVASGQAYGYRVHGRWAPAAGQRSHPSKPLLDPYARAIEGEVRWDEAVFDNRFADPGDGPNVADSAPFAPPLRPAVGATLPLSRGVPMLLCGDEFGRTQGGNNAYRQDSEISWYGWEHADRRLLDFARHRVAFRQDHPVFHGRRWFQGKLIRVGVDIAWFQPGGEEMSDEDWGVACAKSLAVYLNGGGIASRGPHGEKTSDESFLMLFDADHGAVPFRLPPRCRGELWAAVLDTGPDERFLDEVETRKAGSRRSVQARSVVLLRGVAP